MESMLTDPLADALYQAIQIGDLETVKYLVEQGASINDPYPKADQDDANLFLSYASEWGRLPIVKYLLDKGADVNAKGIGGLTALAWAASDAFHHYPSKIGYRGAPEPIQLLIVKLLIDHGADVNPTFAAYPAQTLLTLSCYSKFPGQSIAIELMNRGADVHSRADSFSVLGFSAYNGWNDAVKIAVEKGADVNNPHCLGAALYHSDTLKLLLSLGADVNYQTAHIPTVLIGAITAFQNDAIPILINAGADVNLAYHGETPLKAAANSKNKVAYNLIKAAGGHE